MSNKGKERILDMVCDNTVKAMARDGIMLEDISHDDKSIYVKVAGNNQTTEIRAFGGFTPIDAIRVNVKEDGFEPYVESRLDKRRLASKNPKCHLRFTSTLDAQVSIPDAVGRPITSGALVRIDGVVRGKVAAVAGSDMLVVNDNGKLTPYCTNYVGKIEIV